MKINKVKGKTVFIGICKECHHNVPMTDKTKIPKYENLWECESCGYPNHISDFWQVFPQDELKKE